ncbi:MAG: hypothetical protein SFV24_08350 [Gemmatimonadales bacterium]|nr:hypothetical protein [Gemmatimonadales bacterium]
MAEGFHHSARQGESISSLAACHGLTWERIWNHPENEPLRRIRTHHNILQPGDLVFIPTIRPKRESRPSGARHRFIRAGMPERLEIRILDPNGEPLVNQPFRLSHEAGRIEGVLDSEGWLRVRVPPSVGSATLDIGSDGALMRVSLDLGHLNPIADPLGVLQRLANLGYYRGSLEQPDDDEAAAAVRRFRLEQDLPGDHGLDDAVRERLIEVYGS